MFNNNKNPNKIKDPVEDKIFYVCVNALLGCLLVMVIYPCYFVAIASVTDPDVVNSGKILFWPEGFTTLGYQMVFEDADIWLAYANTIFYTITGTLVGVMIVLMAAYSLSRSDLPFRNIIMGLFVFTMYFSGGLIPTYMLISNIGLLDTRFLLVVLGSVTVYNMIIARTFFANSIPKELQEAATIDGCGNGKFFTSIVLPLSKPIIAVISLYVAVSKWNDYFNPLIYISSGNKYPLQVILRDKLQLAVTATTTVTEGAAAEALLTMAESMKYSTIVVATVPILCIYPFIQKYFAQGVMLGSVKG